MDRLRRWHRDLRLREGSASTSSTHADADDLLGRCESTLEEYTNQVYRALGAT